MALRGLKWLCLKHLLDVVIIPSEHVVLQIYRFYNLSAFTLLLDLAVSVLLIVAYGKGWTTKNNYPVINIRPYFDVT